ncbi:hypothetical protein JCM8547_000432 [Rhodosporidiobolus lusitaniae]
MPARSLALLALAAVTLASSLASAADLSRRQSEDYLSVSWGREGTIPRSTPHYTCDPFPFSINGTAEPFQIDTIEWPYPSDPKKQKVLSSRKRNGGWPGGDVEWTPKTKNGAELVLRITDGTGAVAYSSRRRMKNGGRDYGDAAFSSSSSSWRVAAPTAALVVVVGPNTLHEFVQVHLWLSTPAPRNPLNLPRTPPF